MGDEPRGERVGRHRNPTDQHRRPVADAAFELANDTARIRQRPPLRRLPDEAPGKQQYVEFLKETYGYNIDRLNAAYGLSASSFTDLYSLDYRSLDTTRPSVRQDDLAFLKSLNDVLFADARKFAGRSVRFLQ